MRALLVAVLVIVSACSKEAPLTISAAASLKDVLDEVVPLSGIPSTVNLGASGALQKQIEQGAPVDVFLSAGMPQLDLLEKAGLLDGKRVIFAGNAIVVIVPSSSSAVDLSTVKRVSIGDPATVPAGQHAVDALKKAGLSFDPMILARDVRQVLAYVENGEVDAGLVYATDAASSTKVKVIRALETSKPITYGAVVIKGSKRAAEAHRFIELLMSPAAQQAFKNHGFLDGKRP